MRVIVKQAAVLVAIAALAAIGMSATVAAAEAPPPLFTQFPEDSTAGSTAGHLFEPVGVASDPTTGHVYVADRRNHRISEFSPWGEFVKAWGWGVEDGSPELQTCTAVTGCQAGTPGSGSGQLSFPTGVAVDDSGAIYVTDEENHRVQKFNPAGEFVLMFGGEVNKTTSANVCTKASGDVCGIGTVGTAPGQFGNWSGFARAIIDVGPAGTVFVGGDQDRIQEFNPDGTFQGQMPLPASRSAIALAVDPISGDLWMAPSRLNPVFEPRPVWKLKAGTGEILDEANVGDPAAEPFPIEGSPEALATDSQGNVYVVAELFQLTGGTWRAVVKLKSDGSCLICAGDRFDQTFDGSPPSIPATSTACKVPSDTLYVSHDSSKAYVRAFGSTPDPSECEPPVVPPLITSQFAVSVDRDGALVRAKINPRFWDDTEFQVEYGTEECSKGGCTVLPMRPLGGKPVSFAVTTPSVFLPGLSPGTRYHYRFIANSSGGGPVKGIGGEVGSDGAESTFLTPRAPSEIGPCPVNQQFRTGPSARLPDCRAYEMVSPLDKDSGDIVPLRSINAYPAGIFQSTPTGNRITYSSYRAFGDPHSAPYTSQYLANRVPGSGWGSEQISAPREGGSFYNTIGLDSQFKAFTADLCSGWLLQDAEPRLDPAAPPGFGDLYRRENCGGGGFRALNPTEPTLSASEKFLPVIQGFSEDGGCAVFRANDKLTPDASSNTVVGEGIRQVYESCDGQPLRLVSVLPDGTASQQASSAGTSTPGNVDRVSNVWQAVSADGSRVYWTAEGTGVEGTIYVRVNAEREQSAIAGGECTEAEQACTYPVSESISASPARFLAASSSGSIAYFQIGTNLYEFDLESGNSALVAGQMAGWMGAAEDGARVYLVSKEVRAAGATAGALNLYLYDREREPGEAFALVATLSNLDSGAAALSPIALSPDKRTSRVSPDGGHVAFMSRSKALSELTAGYDNTDAVSDEPDAEVYLYDAGAGRLACVSCNPSGSRPLGRELMFKAQLSGVWAAAQIPGWQTQLSASRVLSSDGSRLYFESFEALDPRDTNEMQDVYQWEQVGRGDCDAGDSNFQESSGGCLSLISSGEGSEDSRFVEATPSGSDVFFATGASLVPQDYGLVDIYDARVDGGLPSPPAPQPPCEGEACQSPAPPPEDPTPSSAAFQGQGNQRPVRCAKNKRRVVKDGKARCVAKKQKKKKSGGKKKRKQKQKNGGKKQVQANKGRAGK